MDTSSLPPIAIRSSRVQTAVALGTPDRVPFVPMLGNIYSLGYDVTIYDAMKDAKNLMPAMEKLLAQYDPDLLNAPTFFPIDVLEFAKSTCMCWPGETHNLPLNTPYQYIDHSYIETDEDFDDFLRDPSYFLLTRVAPKRYAGLSGLAYFNPYGLCGPSPLSFADGLTPPAIEAMEKLIASAKMAMGYIGGLISLELRAIELGYPVFGGAVALNPFDEFADCIRGLIPTITDLLTDPEKVAIATERWGEISIPTAIAKAKMMHASYIMIPLHCGIDEFMSPTNYEKYYWPPLKKLITAIINNGITPFILCEGGYNSRLETLLDVPKGKVIYSFEKVDMKQAKKILGNTACIAGNMPTSALISGTPEKVVELTKKLLDDCAPGGGYIMSNSISLDNVDHRLMEAWHEATLKYGKY